MPSSEKPWQWQKLGMIFCPDGRHPLMLTHAANPVAEHIKDDMFRIYFSARDNKQRAHISYIEIDITNPHTILDISTSPVIGPGVIGTFDDSGTSMGWMTHYQGKRYLYYLGWNLGVTVPWRNSIGLAISPSIDQPFERSSMAPVMDRSPEDPYSISYPCILVEDDLWRMWYGSNLNWGKNQNDMAHLIKYAESTDGIHWHKRGKIALNFKSPDEYAMSKPCVIKENGLYHMWYSFRGKSYCIGYAQSLDGKNWERKDHLAGLTVSKSGWDSETVEYPFVFDHNNQRYMIYNGNGYGHTGFGLARLER